MTERSTDGTDQYRIGDAVDELRQLDAESAAVVVLDDAWARPQRNGAFGVEYPTHAPDADGGTWDIITECRRVLQPGGWLIADCDDWLLPRLIDHIRGKWGDVSATYSGGGYRKTGRVTLTAADGDPDRSTAGEYLTTGGYPVVFAHKGETDRRSSASASQIARRPQERFGWGSVKPVAPYEAWLDGLADEGEQVVVPCAGTAPAAIAAEQLGMEWVAIDCEPAARTAFLQRRDHELADDYQQSELVRADGGTQFSTATEQGGDDA